MLTCPYCPHAMAESTPEHVFPRSIGGGLVLPAHASCNSRANRKIDNHLVQCAHVRWARAAVGLRTPRGKPYREDLLGTTQLMVRPSDTSADRDYVTVIQDGEDIGGAGVRVQLGISQGKVSHVNFLPNPVPHPEGGLQSFTTEETDIPADRSPAFEPYEIVAVVQARRQECRHPADAWQRFTAKVALGVLPFLRNTDTVFEDGFPARESLGEEDYRRLRRELLRLAFTDQAWDAVTPEPSRAARSSSPALRHIVGLVPHGQGARVVLQLFDYLTYRLDIPDVEVHHVVRTNIDISSQRFG